MTSQPGAFVPPEDPFAPKPTTVDLGSQGDSQSASSSGDGGVMNSALSIIQSTKDLPCQYPLTSFFHLFFKVLSIIAYLLIYYISSNSFVFTFIVIIILLAFDFWTVKNVTGRLLVGLRWWNEVKEDGSSEWRYESKENYQPAMADYWVFWGGLYLFPLVWLLFGILAVLKFQFEWLVVIAFAIVLSACNVVGYTKCQKDARKKIMGTLTSALTQVIVQQTLSRQ